MFTIYTRAAAAAAAATKRNTNKIHTYLQRSLEEATTAGAYTIDNELDKR